MPCRQSATIRLNYSNQENAILLDRQVQLGPQEILEWLQAIRDLQVLQVYQEFQD